MSSDDVLADFECLDELVQVIYQDEHRFVMVSTVSSDGWTVHLGLAGSEGRWWRGQWDSGDILQIVGSKPSDKLLETFAEKIAEAVVHGNLYVADWRPDGGTKIKLNFGPSSKKLMHMSMAEITSAEGAAFATNLFIEIALQAQSRRCRLHPDQYAAGTTVTGSITVTHSPPRSKTRSGAVTSSGKEKEAETEGSVVPSSSVKKAIVKAEEKAIKAEEKIKALEAELQRQKTVRVKSPPEVAKPGVVSKPKGASLANPNKRARKYQAIEFASDEE